MNITHTAFHTKPGSTTGETSQRVTMSPKAPEGIRDILARGPIFDGETEVSRLASSMQNSSPFRPRENAIDPGRV